MTTPRPANLAQEALRPRLLSSSSESEDGIAPGANVVWENWEKNGGGRRPGAGLARPSSVEVRCASVSVTADKSDGRKAESQ